MNDYYIYCYLNPLKPGIFKYGDYTFDFEPFYIGKGKGDRINHHVQRCHLKNDRNLLKVHIINKILHLNLDIIKIKLLSNLAEEDALIKEVYFVNLIGRRNLNKGSLANLTNGGDGGAERLVADETKNKISISIKNIGSWIGDKNPSKTKEHREFMAKILKGRTVSEETREKLRKKAMGRCHTAETKTRISEVIKGRKLSDFTKEKISSGNKNKKRDYKMKCNLSFSKLNDKNILLDFFNGIIFIHDNMEESTNFLIINTIISRSVINRIKKNTHWSNHLSFKEMYEIMSKFIDLKDMRVYPSSFNLT